MTGSSPLARGLRSDAGADHGGARIIPARAGFTPCKTNAVAASGDHPRSRGVYNTTALTFTVPEGSSPLARGLPADGHPVEPDAGIIPARAGFTNSIAREQEDEQDHPRSRGVYGGRRRPAAPTCGSSPLARGLPRRSDPDRSGRRIIPARAGFTRPRRPPQPGRPDHPRSRGVYSPGPWAPASSRGSSPLARGLPCGSDEAGDDAGIIPARAGFTPARSQSASRVRDHPRSRGVYSAASATPWPTPGSSPLARGLPHGAGVGAAHARIIPARAGFTAHALGGHGGRRDHPRSRGVYPRERRTAPGSPGSSPLARGLRDNVDDGLIVLRIIPARAGFTEGERSEHDGGGDHPRSRGVYSCAAGADRELMGSSPLARGLHRRLHHSR